MARNDGVNQAFHYEFQDGLEDEHASADHQREDGSTVRQFNSTHNTFGPLQPGRWLAVFVDHTAPGDEHVAAFVWRQGAAASIAASTTTDMFAPTQVCEVNNDATAAITTVKSMEFDVVPGMEYISFESVNADVIRVSLCRKIFGVTV